MRRASNEDLNVDMTGTGLNRGKRKEIEKKKQRFAQFKKSLEEKKNKNNNKD